MRDDFAAGTSASRAVAALVLWFLALATLVVGNHVGFGSNVVREAQPTVAVAAGLFGLAAVVIALPDPPARIALGMALTVQTVAITAAGFFPGFRFVWEEGEAPLTGLLVVVSALALWLLSVLVGANQSEYARSSSSSWSTETRLRVRRPQFSREVWVVTGAVLAVGGALVGHDLGTRWGSGPLGAVLGVVAVGIASLAHRFVWRARRHDAEA